MTEAAATAPSAGVRESVRSAAGHAADAGKAAWEHGREALGKANETLSGHLKAGTTWGAIKGSVMKSPVSYIAGIGLAAGALYMAGRHTSRVERERAQASYNQR